MYDGAYRKLFEQELMVQQLIEMFVGERLASMLDFGGMKQLPIIHHSETLLRRENDLLWEIPTKSGEPLYIVLMLEFQSSPSALMALRIMTYLALCYSKLVEQRGWSFKQGLPPVLPIVLYNGEDDWTPKENIRDLILIDDISPLAPYQPSLEYCLIEVRDYPQNELRENEDLVSTLFLLEQASTPDQISEVLEILIAHTLGEELEGIRRGFLAWIGKVLYHKMDITIPTSQLDSLTEVRDVLAENMEKWFTKTRAELKEQLRDEVKAQVRAEMEAEVKAEMEAEVKAEVKAAVKAEMEAEIKAELLKEVKTEVNAEAEARSRQSVLRLLNSRFGAREGRETLLENYSSDTLLDALTLILEVDTEEDFWSALRESNTVG